MTTADNSKAAELVQFGLDRLKELSRATGPDGLAATLALLREARPAAALARARETTERLKVRLAGVSARGLLDDAKYRSDLNAMLDQAWEALRDLVDLFPAPAASKEES